MARDRHLPHTWPPFTRALRCRAELLVGAVIAVQAATPDVRGAIGSSSFGVLVYYAIANASAWTLTPDQNRPPRIIPAVRPGRGPVAGLHPARTSIAWGATVLALGIAAYGIRRAATARRTPEPLA
ncbi:hypothetical protein PV684_50735 [Streptomyces sp. AK02-04a]|nr:hypothetical protein [Streptomyces sp. AK02-04a]MDX3763262.1 hypothetical protein [Streptomyces sp. AK02-04a]